MLVNSRMRLVHAAEAADILTLLAEVPAEAFILTDVPLTASEMEQMRELADTRRLTVIHYASQSVMVTGSTLQEDIAAVGRNLLLQGRTILGFESPGKPPADHDSKTLAPARPPPAGAAQFQLGGSPTGADPTTKPAKSLGKSQFSQTEPGARKKVRKTAAKQKRMKQQCADADVFQ